MACNTDGDTLCSLSDAAVRKKYWLPYLSIMQESIYPLVALTTGTCMYHDKLLDSNSDAQSTWSNDYNDPLVLLIVLSGTAHKAVHMDITSSWLPALLCHRTAAEKEYLVFKGSCLLLAPLRQTAKILAGLLQFCSPAHPLKYPTNPKMCDLSCSWCAGQCTQLQQQSFLKVICHSVLDILGMHFTAPEVQ